MRQLTRLALGLLGLLPLTLSTGLLLLLALLQHLSPSLSLGLLKLLLQSLGLSLVSLAAVGLLLSSELVVVGHDASEVSLDGEILGVLLAQSFGARDLSVLVSDTITSLLLLVVLLDERNLFATECALEVIDTLGDARELLCEILLVLLDLLDLQLHQVRCTEFRQFLWTTQNQRLLDAT